MKITPISDIKRSARVEIQKVVEKNRTSEVEAYNQGNNSDAEKSIPSKTCAFPSSELPSNRLTVSEIKLLQTPIDSICAQYSNMLDVIHNEKGIPDGLYSKLKAKLDSGNLKIGRVYKEYYELLNLCETEEDIVANFPEITFPQNPVSLIGKNVRTTPVIRCQKSVYKPVNPVWRKYHSQEELESVKDVLQPFDVPSSISDEFLMLANSLNTKVPLLDIAKSAVILGQNKNLPRDGMVEFIKTLKCYKDDNKINNLVDFNFFLANKINETKDEELINSDSELQKRLLGGVNRVANYIAAKPENLSNNDLYNIINSTKNEKCFADIPKELFYLYTESDGNKKLISDLTSTFSPSEIKIIVTALGDIDKPSEVLSSYGKNSDEKASVAKILSDLKVESNFQCVEMYDEKSSKYVDNLDPKTYAHRLKGVNYADVLKDVIKKIYVNFEPVSNVETTLPNGDVVLARGLSRYGRGDWSVPDSRMYKLLKGSLVQRKALLNLSDELSKMTPDELMDIAVKSSTSRFWKDYNLYTSRNWLPIRLIKDREFRPNTTLYTLDNLTTAYLYKLYQESQKAEGDVKYPSNPLASLENSSRLSKYLKNVIDSSYRTIYEDKCKSFSEKVFYRDVNAYENDEGFQEFCQNNNFDKEAIKKSFEKIESLYKHRFFRIYITQDRVDMFRDDLANTVANINEKLAYKPARKIPQLSNLSPKEAQEIVENSIPQEEVDQDKLRKLSFITQKINNPELKSRCEICLSDSNVDGNYFNNVYSAIEQSIDNDETLDETKALTILRLGDKYQEVCNQGISFSEFVAKELKNYKKTDGTLDYCQYSADKETEFELYSKLDKLEEQGSFELYNLVLDLVEKKSLDLQEILSLINDFEETPSQLKKNVNSKIAQIISSSNSDDVEPLVTEISDLLTKVKSWNFDNPEIINSKFVGKVVITPKAKKELWDSTKGNFSLFDRLIKKYYTAATKTAAKDGESGIKVLKGRNIYELKIVGNGGGTRMYSRPVTNEDIEKYKTREDDSDVKYIFDSYGDHL